MKITDKIKYTNDNRAYIIQKSKINNKIYLTKRYGKIKKCEYCNELFFTSNSEIERGFGSFCNTKCARMERFNPNWKGGKTKSNKYKLIKKHNHPNANSIGYISEHRLVMEGFLGRYLKQKEVVHHIDSNPSNNDLNNLKLFKNQAEHRQYDTIYNHIRGIVHYHQNLIKETK